MSFFTLSDNSQIDNTGSFEMGGGNIQPIPDNTQVKAIIDEVKWDEYDGARYISARWSIIDGEYVNRKIFQKIRVCETDSSKKDKALRMLAAIDANAGGGLMKLGYEPTDMDLAQHLTNKPQAILLQTWEMTKDNGEEISGNWVSAVAPVNKVHASSQKSSAPNGKQTPKQTPKPELEEGWDDDIPF